MEGKNILIGLIGIGALAVIGYFLFNNTNYNIATSPNNTQQEGDSDIEYLDEEINENPDSDDAVTAQDILSNPEAFQGVSVNIKAEVEEYLNSRAFVLDAQGLVGDNLLILTDETVEAYEDSEIFGDSIWEIQGEVRTFSYNEAINEVDVDLDVNTFQEYEGKPYIMAERVTLFED